MSGIRIWPRRILLISYESLHFYFMNALFRNDISPRVSNTKKIETVRKKNSTLSYTFPSKKAKDKTSSS
jgi:hypothetical protein